MVEMDGTGGNKFFKIVNRTQEELLWSVTNAALFGAAFSEVIGPKKLSTQQTVQTTAAAGVYEFQIMGLRTNQRVKGGSDPMIIIDT